VPGVILERSMHPDWLSNSYLVGEGPGGAGVLIDAGGPVRPLLEAVERHGLRVAHVLLTHHHADHVAELEAYRRRLGVEALAHPLEAEHIPGVDRALVPGELLEAGGLVVDGIHTPGHSAGMLAFRVNGDDVFTGDTLFKGSVGGVRAPGSTTFEDLKSSVMDVLMTLPADTRLHPGHADPTTVGDEWEENAFVRVWRGLDPQGDEPCSVGGERARLVLWGPDYDGGHKAWVRYEDSGRDDIVGGSSVSRA
jgi:hydroxyacylglutathione hydrolase